MEYFRFKDLSPSRGKKIINVGGQSESQFGLLRGLTQRGLWALSGLWSGHLADT